MEIFYGLNNVISTLKTDSTKTLVIMDSKVSVPREENNYCPHNIFQAEAPTKHKTAKQIQENKNAAGGVLTELYQVRSGLCDIRNFVAQSH